MGVGICIIVCTAYGLREDIVIASRKYPEVTHRILREYYHELSGIRKFFTLGLKEDVRLRAVSHAPCLLPG